MFRAKHWVRELNDRNGLRTLQTLYVGDVRKEAGDLLRLDDDNVSFESQECYKY